MIRPTCIHVLCVHILVDICIASSLSSERTLSDKYTPVSYLRTRAPYVGSEDVKRVGVFWGKSPSLCDLSGKASGYRRVRGCGKPYLLALA